MQDFLELDIEYPKQLWSSHKDFFDHFYQEEKNQKNLFAVQKTKKNMSYI